MKFHPSKKVGLARALRKAGLSSKKIADRLGVADTTILRWCNDIPSRNLYHLSQNAKYQELQKQGAELLKSYNIDQRLAKLLCAALYCCEGTRHPQANAVIFTNSDPELIKTFINLFRIGFSPNEKKFRVHLQLHTSHDKNQATSFWGSLLRIPIKQFYPPTITAATNRMKRTNYKGTCSLRYYDFKFFHKIKGIYTAMFDAVDKTAKNK